MAKNILDKKVTRRSFLKVLAGLSLSMGLGFTSVFSIFNQNQKTAKAEKIGYGYGKGYGM